MRGGVKGQRSMSAKVKGQRSMRSCPGAPCILLPLANPGSDTDKDTNSHAAQQHEHSNIVSELAQAENT